MKSFREILTGALEQARTGQVNAAIEVLDITMQNAVKAKDERWISLLGRNLAILCEHNRALFRAASYLRRAITEVPKDRRAFYQLGDILEQLGDKTGAAVAFRSSLELAQQEKDADLLDSLALRGYTNSNERG